MEATARVIPWNGKLQTTERPAGVPMASPLTTATPSSGTQFGALDGVVIMLPDEQLEAFGKIFCSSPLRRAMTFEGYLIAKGFGQGLSE